MYPHKRRRRRIGFLDIEDLTFFQTISYPVINGDVFLRAKPLKPEAISP
jgi:hypothetical protein